MAFDASSRKVLLLHEGELSDVRLVVEQIGALVVEGVAEPRDWDVAIATPRFLHELSCPSSQPRAVRIAVLEHDARTLRSLCRRSGVDLVVRRPVHPAALRLLLLHALYRGPDRRVPRVAVGVPVRFRTGLRLRRAVLADLSIRGCRLLDCDPAPLGKHVTVYITDPVSRSRQIRTVGRVVRAESRPTGGFAVEFTGLSGSTAERVRSAVAAWSSGPAAFQGREALLTPGSGSADEVEQGALLPPPVAPGDAARAELPAPRTGDESRCEASAAGAPGTAADEPVTAEAAGQEPIAPDPFDRRRAPRHDYRDRRVVALGDQAARVLIGYDVSVGGMRVAPHGTLRLGQGFRVALHGNAGETPLVVQAVVARDDGERGLVLEFQDLPDAGCQRLEKMLAGLPVVEACREEAGGVLVSEILEPDSA